MGPRGELSNWNSHRIESVESDEAVQGSQTTRMGGDGLRRLLKSLYWTVLGLPFGRHHQFWILRLQALKAGRGRTWLRLSSRTPAHSLTLSTRLWAHPTQPAGAPPPQTGAEAAGKLTFHLASYFSSPILTPANEETKTAGGRPLAPAGPCRLGEGGAGGGP